jgi:hypothetical protein
MTNGMIMVQWADLTGRGFSPHEDGPAAPREYWAAAERLLQADLSQPPEGISSTLGHPVWTLRRVQVQGRWLWCFVVQGRRGPFGVAGTCRFAFGTEGMTALETWTAGTEIAAGDQKPPAVPHDPRWFQDVVAEVLGGVVTKQAAIPVTADPGRTATIIPAVLKVLPELELRNWSWSTCMLQRPDSAELGVVSGTWPDEFRREEPHRAESIEELFRRGPATQAAIKARLKRGEVLRGFECLVRHAAIGQRPGAELLNGDYTLDDMLVELGHADFDPAPDDVPSMLETPGGRRWLAEKHLRLVEEWAAHAPTGAVAWLQDDMSSPLEKALLAGVVAAQGDTPENLLGLPTARHPELTAWHKRLTELLRTYRRPKQLQVITGRWIGPAGVLAKQEDRIAARMFLLSLGLTAETDRRYFPPDPRIVIAELNEHSACTPAVREEIGLSGNPVLFLHALSERLDPLPGGTAGDLLWVAALERGDELPAAELQAVRPLAGSLTRAGLCRRADEPWVEAMLGTARQHLGGGDSKRVRRMMYGALEALLDLDPAGPRSPSLIQLCRAIGCDNHASEQVAIALRLAATRGSAPTTYQSQNRSHAQNTGAHPVIRRSGAAGKAWRRMKARFHRGERRRPVVYAVGLGTALALLVPIVAFHLIRADDAPARRKSPAVAATAGLPGEERPPRDEAQIVLPPRNLSTPKDEQDFRAEIDRQVSGPDIPAMVLLVNYGGDQHRAEDLTDQLRKSGLLEETPVRLLSAAEPPPRGVSAGSLVGTVYFNR